MAVRIVCRRYQSIVQFMALIGPPLVLVGCGSVPQTATTVDGVGRPAQQAKASGLPVLPPAGSGRGGYYMDDGPGDNPPEGLLDTPDAIPQIEPYSKRANRPYAVFGKQYTPITDEQPFKQRGVGSWYGRKFHGQKTSSGEPYDMYKMTAAHPTLPIPSFARITNLANGKQVIVRVNDRGPFHSGRIIDLSYTAALKLGYLGKGSGELEVERLLPDEIIRLANARNAQPAPAMQTATVAAAAPVPVAQRPVREAVPSGVMIAAVNLGGTEVTQSIDLQPPAVVQQASAASTPQNQVQGGAQNFYLQLGAYSQAANAEAAREQLARHPAIKPSALEVVEYGQLFRLYSGPFASREEAAAVALALQANAVKAMVVQRDSLK